MIYPILMADVIGSRKLNSTELISEFRKIIKFINKKWAKNILSPLTITLGDEFQAVIDKTENAINIIFDIEERIIMKNYNLKMRFVLNVGKIETKINTAIAYEMLGEGLIQAREKLNELKKSKTRFFISINKSKLADETINSVFRLYENLIDNWKPTEYHFIREFLLKNNYKDVAKKLNINISSSWRREKSLNIEEYSICKRVILNLNSLL